MTSLFQKRLGSEFGRLHPASRERHQVGLDSGNYSVGTGVMERIWHSSVLFAPFLLLGSTRNIMFPESGSNVPFRIECWPYRDRFERETLSLNRSFRFTTKSGDEKWRRFDEYVVDRGAEHPLSIYVGDHQHLTAAMEVKVGERGSLVFETGAQRLFTRWFSLRFPLALSASARVEEWFDEEIGRFRIQARVRNRFFGDVFSCDGTFDSETKPMPADGVPDSVRPIHEERRVQRSG